ncbi:MAG: CopG family transcriptional regulator [Terracidiphilus sp.]
MRTLVDIPAEDLKLLNGVVKTLAISRAEFVRRAIAKSLEPHRLSQKQKAFGLWANRPVDGLKYQERMRKEWQEGTSSSTPTS